MGTHIFEVLPSRTGPRRHLGDKTYVLYLMYTSASFCFVTVCAVMSLRPYLVLVRHQGAPRVSPPLPRCPAKGRVRSETGEVRKHLPDIV